MKSVMLLLAVTLMISACQSKDSESQSKGRSDAVEEQEIRTLLFAYRDALNASDVDAVMPLYTAGGVFMPSGAPTSVGAEQVKGAYEFVFSNIKLNIDFVIDEITVDGEYAFARTTSKGSTLIHATGETVPEENRELFVLLKVNESWKIDRYMFNKMK